MQLSSRRSAPSVALAAFRLRGCFSAIRPSRSTRLSFSGATARRIEPDGTELGVPAPFMDDEGRLRERVTLAEVADAYLFLGPTASLTLAEPPLRSGEPLPRHGEASGAPSD